MLQTLDLEFTEEQKEIVNLSRQLAEKKIKPIRMKCDEEEHFPWEIVEELRKADLFGVYLPAEYGGLGGGNTELCLVTEEVAKVCGGIALCVAGTGLGTIPILLMGSEEQKKRWLPDLAGGKKLGAFAITEAEAGSDATALKTTAKKDGDHYILNGSKSFISNGEVAEIYIVFANANPAKGPRGITAFVVDKGTPGFTFGKKEQKMGIRANPTYELFFDNCRVPAANVLGGEGYGLFVAQATFDFSRPGVGAQAIGIAEGALDEAIHYIRVRKQFGQPIISFQAIQHMIADCATRIEAARSLLYNVNKGMDVVLKEAVSRSLASGKTVYQELRGLKPERLTKYSAMVKLFCSDVAMQVTTDCVQMCGGIGYMRDFPVEKYMRDAKVTQIYEGTSQMQRNEIAMMIIKEYATAAKAQAVAV
ncbi:MAG: acyl-CoA dehydrogenase family protein [Elusimicrobia bacterium]|nr:acyl-CoA dehydrogenase family protein [Elusimicrobiota bacterium]